MELKDKTVATLIEMDEPEALLALIRREAQRQKGARWQLLARVLAQAEVNMDQELNAKPAGPTLIVTENASVDQIMAVIDKLDGKPADTEAKAE